MAKVRIKENDLDQVIIRMANGTGTSRADEHYYISKEIDVSEIHTLAMKKKVLVEIVYFNEIINILKFVDILI